MRPSLLSWLSRLDTERGHLEAKKKVREAVAAILTACGIDPDKVVEIDGREYRIFDYLEGAIDAALDEIEDAENEFP